MTMYTKGFFYLFTRNYILHFIVRSTLEVSHCMHGLMQQNIHLLFVFFSPKNTF